MEIKAGYKQTEVGVIPQDWDAVLLDSIARRGSGHTPNKKHPEYWNGDIKWISLMDSNRLDNVYIHDTVAKITPQGIANSSAVLHPAGTVVLSRDAGVGKSGIMSDSMAVSQHYMAWVCGSHLNNHFLYYWLQSEKTEFERIANGSTIKTIGLQYFKDLKIPLTSVVEQLTIATALSDLDALITSQDKLIAKKRDIKQVAMQDLLTGKRRLPGFDCGKGYKQTESGMIPEDWDVKELGEISFFSQGVQVELDKQIKEEKEGFIRFLRIENYTQKSDDFRYIPMEECGNKLVEYDDVVVVRYGATAGFVGRGLKGILANNLFWIEPKKILTKDFLFITLNSDKAFRYFQISMFGGAMPALSFKVVKDYPLSIPPLPEQQAITTALSDMDSELSALEQKRNKTKAIKQGMMQELLTGRIRLI